MANYTNVILIVFISAVYLTGFFSAFNYNSDFGNLEVKEVTFFGEEKICGLIYRLKNSSELNPCPAVVLCHGISGSKQMMSGMALELARNGFVALTIDLIGHGSSSGA
ncbi:MAG: alpha/beta fold hydrolase [Thermoproteota archaeon]